ncbi:MAG: glycosyltransferase family 4 protein [Clostridium sp.]
MRIAMIGHRRIPSREGGVEIVVNELSKRLVNLGVEVDAYNRKSHHNCGKNFDKYVKNNCYKTYEGVNIIWISTVQGKHLEAFLYSFLATCKAIFRKYDYIHYHAEGPSVMLLIPHILGIKTVATIHGLDCKRKKWSKMASMYLKLGECIAAKYADEVIVLSKNIQKYFQETYNRTTHFIANGVTKPEIKGDSIIRKKYNLKKDGYIAFIARLVPEKGLHYLIEAYKKLDTDKKLVISGGSSNSNDYKNQVVEMAGDDERILFTDFIQGEELEEIYSNAYIYVLPSDVEGMAISLLEAMSYGNCCLVSDIPENMEVVEDKAVSFKKGNVDDLREKLEFLLNNEEYVKRYKSLSREYICRKYNWDATTAKTLEVYKKNYKVNMEIKCTGQKM